MHFKAQLTCAATFFSCLAACSESGDTDDNSNITPGTASTQPGPGADPSSSSEPGPGASSGPNSSDPTAHRGCTPGRPTSSGQLRGYFGRTPVTIDGQSYHLQVNQWNHQQNTAPAQVIDYGGNLVFKMLEQGANVPTNDAPTGYPSIFIGSNYGNTTNNPNLPKQISALTTVPTTWVWNDAGTLNDRSANSYNVAYDVWFSTGSGGDYGNPSGGYLMVWLHKPNDADPIGGSPSYYNIEVENVPGRWDAWVGIGPGGPPIISYVAAQPMLELSFDLVDFINDSIDKRSTLTRNMYLTNIFAGFEIWRGGVGIETTSFCAIVN